LQAAGESRSRLTIAGVKKYGGMAPDDGQGDESSAAEKCTVEEGGSEPGPWTWRFCGRPPAQTGEPRTAQTDGSRGPSSFGAKSDFRAAGVSGNWVNPAARSVTRLCEQRTNRRCWMRCVAWPVSVRDFGSPRIHEHLLTQGWQVNHKRVHRLWKQEHLQVPRKQHRRRRLPGSSENSCIGIGPSISIISGRTTSWSIARRMAVS